MKQLTQWILALVVLASAASFSAGAWTVQEPPKAKQEKVPKQQKKAQQVGQKGRGDRHQAILKLLPEMKTSLAEGIALAEKQTTGKAFSAGIELIKGKASIQVNLFVGEKFTVANVDPDTKVVVVAQKKEDTEGDGEKGADGDKDGDKDGGDEDGEDGDG